MGEFIFLRYVNANPAIERLLSVSSTTTLVTKVNKNIFYWTVLSKFEIKKSILMQTHAAEEQFFTERFEEKTAMLSMQLMCHCRQ